MAGVCEGLERSVTEVGLNYGQDVLNALDEAGCGLYAIWRAVSLIRRRQTIGLIFADLASTKFAF